MSSKCEVGYDYKVFNTATGAAQALTICRAHGATIANPAQFKKIKNPPKTSWVIEGNKMVVYNSKGKKIGKSGKAAFVCVVSNKEGCGAVVCMDNKCTPIGELKNTKIDGSKVYLTNEDGHHYRAKDILLIAGSSTKTCKLNTKTKKYKCTTVKGKAPAQKKCFVAKDGAKICVQKLGYVGMAKCNIKKKQSKKDQKNKVGSADMQCLSQRVCVSSKKLKGLLCTDGKSRKVMCFKQKGKTVCWNMQDVAKLKYSLWCREDPKTKNKKKKVLQCKLVVHAVCMKNGKCQEVSHMLVTKPGSSLTSKYSNKTCARLIMLHLGVTRLNIYCKKEKKDEVACKINAQAAGTAKAIAQKRKKGCEMPKNLIECREEKTQANDCQVKIEKCKGFKNQKMRKDCFRQIYARCITVVYAVKHYCDKQSLDVKLSAECVAIEQKEMKCYLYYKECKSAKTKKEKAQCEKDLELDCAEVSLVYLQCFFDKHGKKQVKGGKKGLK